MQKDIISKGFGIAPKMVMIDKRLTIEAKGIYMYLSSFCGNKKEAYPRVSTILDHLNISKNRFYRHIEILEELGYIQVKGRRKKNKNNKWVADSNMYILSDIIDTSLQVGKDKVEKLDEDDDNIENTLEILDENDCKPKNTSKKEGNINKLSTDKDDKNIKKIDVEGEADFNNSANNKCWNDRNNSYENKLKTLSEFGYQLSKEQKELLKDMDEVSLEKAIKISVAQGGKTFKYVYKVYTTTVETDKRKSKLLKNKGIYMCDTTVAIDGKMVKFSELDDDKMEQLIQQKTKSKYKTDDGKPKY